jgi:Flp pilus assembly protein TadG
MKLPYLQKTTRRRGAIAAMTALLLIPLLGMVAFAVDLAWIVQVQADLQNSADASALAGAGQLMDGYVQYNLPGQTTAQLNTIQSSAQTKGSSYAKTYAGYNAAGGVYSLTLNDGDIQFGWMDAQGNYTPQPTYTGYPNTIKVTLRRDDQANGSLGLFFAPVFGATKANLAATATATTYSAVVDSFQNTPSLNVRVLPVGYDVNHWNTFLQTGKDPDGHSSTDLQGHPTLQVYPSVKYKGNFGMVTLDGSHAGASTISSWVDNGLGPNERQGLIDAGVGADTPLIPLSQHNANILPSASQDGKGSWNWVGEPGMKESVVHTIDNYVGTTFLLPLFKPLDPGIPDPSTYAAGIGEGSHYDYNIVQFVSIKIVSAGSGVTLVPSPSVLDFDQVIFASKPTPTGSSGQFMTTFAPPKLTQ